MSNVTQIALQGKLSIADTTINVVDGLYSLNDLHKASGGETKHQPSNFMRNDEIKALIAEIEHSSNLMNGNIYKAYKRIKGGLNQGLTSAVNWPIVMLCGLVLNLGRVIMPENTSMPFFVKALALTIGGIIALIVSGDIDLDGKIKITLGVILKFASSVGLGLYIGEFIWDYWDLHIGLGYYAQGAAMMAFSIFGMLIVGILYQSLQMLQENTKRDCRRV